MFQRIEKTKNGAEVLFKKISPMGGFVVLCSREHPFHPLVTWRMDHDGNCEHGHYFDTVYAACQDFHDRT